MRVIAGELGGRFFESPETSTTHPMGERIRGALFNMLGDGIKGKTVLEPFAGSGALSFEALSRGAKSAVLLEREKRAQQCITRNITNLGLWQKAKLIKANCRMWAETNDDKFDLLLVDPPYYDMQLSTVSSLINHLNQNGLMVLSYQGRGSAPTVNGVVVVDTRLYGDAALAFYRLTA